MADIKYKRVILKLSGEALAGDKGFGINPPVLKDVAKELNRTTEGVFGRHKYKYRLKL